MYPAGHPALEQMLTALGMRFKEYFKSSPTLMVGIGKESLFLGDVELTDEDWAVNLATALHQQSISQITFHRGLGLDELSAMMEVLRMDPLTVRESGGYRELFAERRIRSIEVNEVEYKLHEEDIERQLEQLSDSDVWRRLSESWRRGFTELGAEDRDFVQRLLQDAPRLATIVDTALAGHAEGTDTAEAAQVFFRVVDSLAPFEGEIGAEDRMAFEGQVLRVINSLSPEGRYALLEDSALRIEHDQAQLTSIDHLLNKLDDRNLARGLVEGLDPNRSHLDDFIRTYEHFVDDQREQPLLDEIESIVTDRDVKYDANFAALVARASQLPADQPRLFRLRRTLISAHEQYISRNMPIYDYVEAMMSRSTQLLERLSDSAVEEAAALNLLSILRMQRDSEHYEFYSQGLDYMIADLIETGRYALAEQAVRLLRSHASKRNTCEVSRNIARQLLTNVRTPEIVAQLLQALKQWGKEQAETIGQLLVRMGPIAVEPVIEALDAEQNRAVRMAMISVLTQNGKHVMPLIDQRMRDADWFVQRNMVNLLAQIAPDDLLQRIEPVVDNPEPRVRKVVARALTATDEEGAIDLLEAMLADPDQGVRHQAILSLGHFRGSEKACKVLLGKIEQRHPFSGDARAEQLALDTLGKIRHPLCIEALARYIHGSALWGGPDEELRVSAAKALGVFENPQCRKLLEEGCNSRKKALRDACRQLLQVN
ncbi:MAG: HEAT repeat domain-containing protein [Candidatus Alcyoniella australis]|nr:HEAT repeat domain-containing protein [Candidatus Alcyoniella australis]